MLRPEHTGPIGPQPEQNEHDSEDAIRRELIAVRAASYGLMPLVDALNGQRHPVASVADATRLVEGVKAGSVWNGYTMSRLMGLSRAEAREHPATAMHLAITHFLGADLSDFDEIVTGSSQAKRGFHVDMERY